MLEQAYDTKELNRVQRRLAIGGKLVGKPVHCWVTGGSVGVRSIRCFVETVDQTGVVCTLPTGYQQRLPRLLFFHCR